MIRKILHLRALAYDEHDYLRQLAIIASFSDITGRESWDIAYRFSKSKTILKFKGRHRIAGQRLFHVSYSQYHTPFSRKVFHWPLPLPSVYFMLRRLIFTFWAFEFIIRPHISCPYT